VHRKGKAHAPYEFGVKVTFQATDALHVTALPRNPYDGHTLEKMIPAMEDTIGAEIERLLAEAGYRGHNAPQSHKFRVFTAGQKRRTTPVIKREMRRRSAIEPVIGHIKSEHPIGRNYLAHSQGDATNAILAAAGYNFSLLLKWLRTLLSLMTPAPPMIRPMHCPLNRSIVHGRRDRKGASSANFVWLSCSV
jgi:IS5 family transposase